MICSVVDHDTGLEIVINTYYISLVEPIKISETKFADIGIVAFIEGQPHPKHLRMTMAEFVAMTNPMRL